MIVPLVSSDFSHNMFFFINIKINTERHNDLFGLAIFQFEREYKACLERRKHNEPQILNILFPIKTGNRYLEYLESTQSQQTGKYNFII
jgi:hypothetical protein